ncbi:tyrosine-type recombinase/integrase [Falsiruegeria mediterranea]
MRIYAALIHYKTDHLDHIKTSAARRVQLTRILENNSSSGMHTVSNVDLNSALSQWKGATRNRYKAALTHFWKWGRAHGYTDLHPTLLAEREQPRDQVLSMTQLRTLYRHAEYFEPHWALYGRLLILTGQRHGDLMGFHTERMQDRDLHLPTSKNGTPHIVTLGPKAQSMVRMCCFGFNMATTAHFKRRWFRRAGIPLSYRLHDIRRSFATHLAEAGEDEADIDRMLNHCASQTAKGVARTYNRARRLTQRHEIIDQWEWMLFGQG